MSEGVELIRGIGAGAVDIAHLPVALGAFVCRHVAMGERSACKINIDGGDLSAVCEDMLCWESEPELTSLCRVLHFAPDAGGLGPAHDGWSFTRNDAGSAWMVWAPDADAPVDFRRAHDA